MPKIGVFIGADLSAGIWECDIWVENHTAAKTAVGRAVVILPKLGETVAFLSPTPEPAYDKVRERDRGDDSWITPEAKSVIGKWSPPELLGEITLTDIQRYATSMDDFNSLYFDEEYARSTPYGGIVAPPTFLTAMRYWGAGTPEEHLAPGGREAVEGRNLALLQATRQFGGGQELDFFKPVRPGDTITRRSRIKDIYEKKGRSGRLAFIIFEAVYTNQNGESLVTCIDTKIAR